VRGINLTKLEQEKRFKWLKKSGLSVGGAAECSSFCSNKVFSSANNKVAIRGKANFSDDSFVDDLKSWNKSFEEGRK